MKTVKAAYYTGTHTHTFRCGEAGLIIGVVMYKHSEDSIARPCFVIQYADGFVDHSVIGDKMNNELTYKITELPAQLGINPIGSKPEFNACEGCQHDYYCKGKNTCIIVLQRKYKEDNTKRKDWSFEELYDAINGVDLNDRTWASNIVGKFNREQYREWCRYVTSKDDGMVDAKGKALLVENGS